jgi:alpha/beta hydrolase family protein DUF900
MPSTTVYFASNRVTTGPANLWQSYGADIVAPADATQIRYATAFVDGIDLTAEGSGAITAIENDRLSDFDDGVKGDIVGSGKNLLVFVHGFANSFKDGITRAAFNREWFAASGLAPADTTIIAFSWPSLGQLIAAPPHLLPDDYLRDQTQAGRSGFHIASFLKMVEPLITQVRAQGRRAFLLAHSMGNFALQGAVESWFAHGNPATDLFDEVFLAAADERYDTFGLPAGARLSLLKDLGRRISIYYSVRDIAMYLSFAVNLIARLGRTRFSCLGNRRAARTIPASGVESQSEPQGSADCGTSLVPRSAFEYRRRLPRTRSLGCDLILDGVEGRSTS